MTLTSPPLNDINAVDPARIREALAALHYLETHGKNIETALEIARQHAYVESPDIDDESFWCHEQRAFNQWKTGT
jgi:hypothetical protein